VFTFLGKKPIPLPLPVGRGEEKKFEEIFGTIVPKISSVSSFSPPRFGEGTGVGIFARERKCTPLRLIVFALSEND
jgi:hypothetical protein